MTETAESIGLHYHPEKTFIVDQNEPFPFMGTKICGNVIDYDEQYIQSLIRNIKTFAKKTAVIKRKQDLLPERQDIKNTVFHTI
jgi:hypothetical protein